MIQKILTIILTTLLVGCSQLSEQETTYRAKKIEVCANVTNDNWFSSAWDPESTAKSRCEAEAHEMLADNMRPCSVGGFPLRCRVGDNGEVRVVLWNGAGFKVPKEDLNTRAKGIVVF